jgi:excisionase family DNA binding protein
MKSAWRGVARGGAPNRSKSARGPCRYTEERPDAEIHPCPRCGFKLWPKGNVRTIRFHDLRHTYASVLLMSGAALVSVQRLLGHSDPKITERRYGHLLPDFMAAEVNRLRFGLDHLVPRPLGTSLVQSADPEKREAGAPLFSAGIPASLLAGCRGLEPLASGVTGKLVVCQCVAARRNRLESLETARTRKRTLRRIWQPFARRRLQLQSREGCPGGGGPARFLAVRDVAAALGVTPATIYKLCKQGKLLHARVSNAIRVPEAALAKYLAAGRSPPGPR